MPIHIYTSTNMIGPAKTGHMGKNYTPPQHHRLNLVYELKIWNIMVLGIFNVWWMVRTKPWDQLKVRWKFDKEIILFNRNLYWLTELMPSKKTFDFFLFDIASAWEVLLTYMLQYSAVNLFCYLIILKVIRR